METPVRKQRLGAYAVIVVEGRILLTRISSIGYGAGSWVLPGGGVEHGEEPRDAVRREAYEETGLDVVVDGLLDVHSLHITGRAPDGVLEDYHGVHLLFSCRPSDPGADPHVTEVDGTTDAVAWVPVDDITSGRHPAAEIVTVALAAGDKVGRAHLPS